MSLSHKGSDDIGARFRHWLEQFYEENMAFGDMSRKREPSRGGGGAQRGAGPQARSEGTASLRAQGPRSAGTHAVGGWAERGRVETMTLAVLEKTEEQFSEALIEQFLSAVEDERRYDQVQQFCRQIVECQRLWHILIEEWHC